MAAPELAPRKSSAEEALVRLVGWIDYKKERLQAGEGFQTLHLPRHAEKHTPRYAYSMFNYHSCCGNSYALSSFLSLVDVATLDGSKRYFECSSAIRFRIYPGPVLRTPIAPMSEHTYLVECPAFAFSKGPDVC